MASRRPDHAGLRPNYVYICVLLSLSLSVYLPRSRRLRSLDVILVLLFAGFRFWYCHTFLRSIPQDDRRLISFGLWAHFILKSLQRGKLVTLCARLFSVKVCEWSPTAASFTSWAQVLWMRVCEFWAYWDLFEIYFLFWGILIFCFLKNGSSVK